MWWQEAASQAASLAASVLAVLGPVTALGAGAGVLPRAGPARALALALRSRLTWAQPASQRLADVAALRASLLVGSAASQYLVVRGPKGVGKSCVVATATQHRCGVVAVDVAAGTSGDAIVAAALSAVARVYPSPLVPSVLPSARRVIFWHRLVAGPPTIVLHMEERQDGAGYADATGAVRRLVGYGLNVIIDASENSLSPSALATWRQDELVLEAMPRATLESIAPLQPLLDALRRAGVDDAMWAVLGGCPAAYELLHTRWAKARFAAAAVLPLAHELAQEALALAVARRDRAVAADSRLAALYECFAGEAGSAAVPLAMTREMQLPLPSPEKVLRAVRRGAAVVLLPADAAMALVLRHNMQDAPTLDELALLLRAPVAAAAL